MNSFFHNTCRCILVALLPLVLASHAAATNQDGMTGPVAVGSTEVLSVVGGLISVIAAILLVSFLYSRMKAPRLGGDAVIKIIASQALGAKERIVLVEIANTQLVIGTTTSQVQTLHVFDEPVVNAREERSGFNFAERLKLILRGDHK
jgi:flagellar protein FliO/FliZ